MLSFYRLKIQNTNTKCISNTYIFDTAQLCIHATAEIVLNIIRKQPQTCLLVINQIFVNINKIKQISGQKMDVFIFQ